VQVAVERTKPNGRIVGIDIIPAQPPKGVSTIQGNFLSAEVQSEVKRFLSDPDRGRPKQQLFSNNEEEGGAIVTEEDRSYIDLERRGDEDVQQGMTNKRNRKRKEDPENIHRHVDVVLSDMSAPWMQTTGFWKRSLSNPYIRMMNTSGINFRDHAGSMVSFYHQLKPTFTSWLMYC
jgi:21S rRNA (uridine2791-2'-O)-methyltransferase